jgi:CcmD family protein
MSFLLAAYAVLWIGLFGYLLRLAARIGSLREEARALAAEEPAADTEPSARR